MRATGVCNMFSVALLSTISLQEMQVAPANRVRQLLGNAAAASAMLLPPPRA
jgi:hypothetical protein